MNLLLKLAGTIVLAAGMGVPALAQTVTVPGQSTTATYMDYMKTVYARAAGSDMIQIGLTADPHGNGRDGRGRLGRRLLGRVKGCGGVIGRCGDVRLRAVAQCQQGGQAGQRHQREDQ